MISNAINNTILDQAAILTIDTVNRHFIPANLRTEVSILLSP